MVHIGQMMDGCGIRAGAGRQGLLQVDGGFGVAAVLIGELSETREDLRLGAGLPGV